MNDNDPKIVVLQDYLKARDLLKQEGIEALLAKERAELRAFEAKVLDLLSGKHKLKDTRFNKNESILHERILSLISDCLEDKIAETTDEKGRQTEQYLFKQCEKLISKHERIKKNIADDLADCRFEIFKPLTIAGFVGTASVTAKTLAELITKNPNAILCVAIAGATLGAFLAFHYHATVGEFAKEAIVKSPRQFRSSKKNARNSAFATALRISVAAKQVSEIESRRPVQSVDGSRTVIVAKYSG